MGAMDFDRTRRYVELIGDNLIRRTRDQTFQHLPFAFGQKGDASGGRLRELCLTFALLAEHKRLFDALQQKLNVEWLFDEIYCSGLHRSDSERYIAMTRHDDHGEQTSPTANSSGNVEPSRRWPTTIRPIPMIRFSPVLR